MKKNDIGHTSSVILVNEKNEILLSKRKSKEGEGLYGFPGGKREKGEKPIDAAKRELKEELGIDVSNLKMIDKRKKKLSKIWQIILFYTFVSESQQKNIKNMEPNKTESLDWFELDKLPKNIWEHNRQYIIDNLEKIKSLTEKTK